MMPTLIIDGYNVIYAIPKLEELLDESLEAARIGLMRTLIDFKNSVKNIKRIYVVFDGKSEFFDEEIPAAPDITEIYTSSSKDADKKILEIIKDSDRPGDITVVSNDNFLYNNARAHGAHIKTVAEFCGML